VRDFERELEWVGAAGFSPLIKLKPVYLLAGNRGLKAHGSHLIELRSILPSIRFAMDGAHRVWVIETTP
jgi:hypothetical protein